MSGSGSGTPNAGKAIAVYASRSGAKEEQPPEIGVKTWNPRIRNPNENPRPTTPKRNHLTRTKPAPLITPVQAQTIESSAATNAAPRIPDREHYTWHRQALRRIQRHLEEGPGLNNEQAAHVLLWVKDVTANIPQDPRSEAILSAAASIYAEIVKVQANLILLDGTGVAAEKAQGQLIRCSLALGKLLRLAGVQRAIGHKGKQGGDSSVFTAPREPMPSEQRQESSGEERVEAA